jgi:hypothetical protein
LLGLAVANGIIGIVIVIAVRVVGFRQTVEEPMYVRSVPTLFQVILLSI